MYNYATRMQEGSVSYEVAVVGASGYSGGELLRLLAGHPSIEVAVATAETQAGRPVADLHPNLDTAAVLEEADAGALAGLDLVLLATPHAVSLELGGQLVAKGTPVVDLSGAFRLPPDDFAAWYGEPHTHPELSELAVYGLTEFHRDELAGARLVANPGCYPTAALLALLPLRELVEPGSVVVDAKSGTSGAGRGLRDDLHHANVAGDLVAYGAPRHRHTPEIERELGLGAVSFTPHLLPIARGLLATCYATLAEGMGEEDVRGALLDAYGDEPFVRVLPPGRFPHAKAVAGSNGGQVSAVVDERTRRVVVTSAIDNLGKGAAGQALQNANLVLGLEETLGLTATGIYP